MCCIYQLNKDVDDVFPSDSNQATKRSEAKVLHVRQASARTVEQTPHRQRREKTIFTLNGNVREADESDNDMATDGT